MMKRVLFSAERPRFRPSTGIRTWNVGWTCTTSISRCDTQRIRDKMGKPRSSLIRFTDTPLASGNDFDQVPYALEVIDEWMGQHSQQSDKDRC